MRDGHRLDEIIYYMPSMVVMKVSNMLVMLTPDPTFPLRKDQFAKKSLGTLEASRHS